MPGIIHEITFPRREIMHHQLPAYGVTKNPGNCEGGLMD